MGTYKQEDWDSSQTTFTSNTTWLEEIQASGYSPEFLLSELEDALETGEITEEQLIVYYHEGTLP